MSASGENRSRSTGEVGENQGEEEAITYDSLQLRVLSFGLLQDGDVGVCVFHFTKK